MKTRLLLDINNDVPQVIYCLSIVAISRCDSRSSNDHLTFPVDVLIGEEANNGCANFVIGQLMNNSLLTLSYGTYVGCKTTGGSGNGMTVLCLPKAVIFC